MKLNGDYFDILDQEQVNELSSTVTFLEHKKSGARILHLGSEDQENCFSLSFRTYPSRSDGVAHILEHVTLCGSKKYPIRDPFFEMMRRSLCTFMNAITCPDFTCYPAATQNEKDFYHLLDIYIDAVFFPLLTRESFLQEGHRLVFDQMNDPTSRLKRQGVVFNEMKGIASSADYRMGRLLLSGLTPDLPYRFESGGDPQEIPKLTYEELKTFHKEFYHPSRCLFYFYGNIPLEKHLAYLQERLLLDVERLSPLPQLKPQPRFESPKQFKGSFPTSGKNASQEKGVVSFTWLTTQTTDILTIASLELIDILLCATDGSPLTRALLDSGLCKQVESYIDSEMSEAAFLLICRGCDKGSEPALVQCMQSTLKKICEEGFNQESVEGALHQLELDRLEITNHGQPYGLTLFYRAATQIQHGGNPLEALKAHALFERLRIKLKDPNYLLETLKKHLLDNPHRVDTSVFPSKTLGKEEDLEEREQLKQLKDALSEKQKQMIVEDSMHLYEMQENVKEDLSLLPKLLPEDLPKKEQHYPLEFIDGKLPLYHHDCFTNGFVYVNLTYSLPDLTVEELPYLRLLALFLTQIGREGLSYTQHLEELVRYTGGIKCWIDTNCQADNPHEMHPTFTIRGKALERNVPKLFEIIKGHVESADFTNQNRLGELLNQHIEFVENSIQNSPLPYAMHLAGSSLSVPALFAEKSYGLSYYNALKKILVRFKENPHELSMQLQKVYGKVLRVDQPHLVLSCPSKAAQEIIDASFYGLDNLPTVPTMPWKGEYSLESFHSQGRLISTPVAFTVYLFPSVSFTHPDAPLISLAAEMMTHTTLHKKVREQGGAYGSEAVHLQPTGQFYLYSYRDPNLKKTLVSFTESIQKIANGAFTDEHIEEAKLSFFQAHDAPTSPGQRAETTYLYNLSGQTLERREEFRKRLLTASKQEIQSAVQSHLLSHLHCANVTSFASREFFDEENHLLETPLPIFEI